jgi:prolipoprotein diacylglyceryltransferase
MQQVLFWLPLKTEATPNGIPIYGFGAMLFVAFVVCTWLAGRRAEKEGIGKEHIQDLAIWIFVGGLVGARIVYMIQYGIPFWPITNFFRIWEGGLVFYGSALGGLAGYGLAWVFMIRRHGLSTWKILDVIAPAAAMGLCLGRLGCLFNGCCYGNVACPDCYAIRFPLSAPPRYTLVDRGYQTAAGFTMKGQDETPDPRTVVDRVEPGSPAEQAGVRPGDEVVRVNGLANRIIVQLKGRPDAVKAVVSELPPREVRPRLFEDRGLEITKVYFDRPQDYAQDIGKIRHAALGRGVEISVHDVLWDLLVNEWPRGEKALELTVQRDGQEVELPSFVPRTLGLHPTQIYESISMLLLFFLLTAYYPFRRHDGEVMVLFMIAYSLHRFLNEMLRSDTDPIGTTGMTLSQNGSIIIFVAGVLLAIWLWRKPVQYPATSATS